MAVELAQFTTLGIGGAAAYLEQPETRDELVAVVREAWASGEAWLVLGGGSNVVISDDGFDGVVVRVATRGIELEGDLISVEAGEPWDDVVAVAGERGLAGIETLSGIPGTTGAAPIQNIGAYGQQLSSTLAAVDFLDYETGDVIRLTAEELDLGYRTSAIKAGRIGVVLRVVLRLSDTGGRSEPIAYDQLAGALGVSLGDRAPLADTRAAVLALRASKGMLLNPADPDSVSAGSFFTNPIVTENFARRLPVDAPRWLVEPEAPALVLPLGSAIPVTAASEHLVKLSAAWLIERSGIARGFALPGSGAAISSKHTLAIINRGGASSDDVAELARYIQTRVLSEFGVNLHPEPVLVGVQL